MYHNKFELTLRIFLKLKVKMNSQENIVPEGAKTVFIENVGTVIIPPRNTEQDILDIAEAMKDDLETLRELLCVVKVCDEDIKSEIVEGVPVTSSVDKSEPAPVPAAGFGMDEANKKALNVLNNEGEEEFMKHVFTDQETGRKLSYSEMRMRYG